MRIRCGKKTDNYMKQWYEELPENYGRKYDNESFAQGTIKEWDFIEQEIDYNKSLKILDLGCEIGRDSIELAKRGYTLTGIDLSKSFLDRAHEKANEQNVKINFIQADARELNFSNEFDIIIMLCEGAFPLMETDEMNYKILKNASNALKCRGKIIFTILNGIFLLYHSVEEFCASTTDDGNVTYHSNTFDLMTFRDFSITAVEDDLGNKKELKCNERYYVPSEITWLLKSLNFITVDIF
jgi:2-polyprenyl-3-methyl-5-hydroxy-6-metoxy-1,4-benzoquinol methylase